MKSFLKEPLVHFLIIGALLFIFFDIYRATDQESEKTIRITEAQIETLRASFTRTWRRPPTNQELEGLVKELIREEIACREATSMGLDRDDPYIRRRLKMKMDFMLEDMSELVPPTDKELTLFLQQHRELFRVEPKVRFSHVYLEVKKHGDSLQDDTIQLLKELVNGGPNLDLDQYGDPTILPKTVPLSFASAVDRQFGKSFTEQLAGLDVGVWQGPVTSSYGLHLVLVHDFIQGWDPNLSEARAVVEREFMARRRQELKEQTYEKLLDGYLVVMEDGASVRE